MLKTTVLQQSFSMSKLRCVCTLLSCLSYLEFGGGGEEMRDKRLAGGLCQRGWSYVQVICTVEPVLRGGIVFLSVLNTRDIPDAMAALFQHHFPTFVWVCCASFEQILRRSFTWGGVADILFFVFLLFSTINCGGERELTPAYSTLVLSTASLCKASFFFRFSFVSAISACLRSLCV